MMNDIGASAVAPSVAPAAPADEPVATPAASGALQPGLLEPATMMNNPGQFNALAPDHVPARAAAIPMDGTSAPGRD